MKKIRWIVVFIALSPLYLTFAAGPVPIRILWADYENPTGTRDTLATMSAECKFGNNGAFAPVGSTSSANSSLAVTLTASPGDAILCDIWATENGVDSPRSEVAQYNVPFPVPAMPQGVRLVAR